jgi:hypothetical protein
MDFIYSCINTEGMFCTKYFAIAPVNKNELYYDMVASFDGSTGDDYFDKSFIVDDINAQIVYKNNNGYTYKVTYKDLPSETADDINDNERLVQKLSFAADAKAFPDPNTSILGRVLFPHMVIM